MNNLRASPFNSCFTLKHEDCILSIVNVIFQNLRRFPWPRPDLLCKGVFCVADKIGIKCFSRILLVAYDRKSQEPQFYGPIKW